ncbi:DUF6708 domain-containing protein [Pseudomonas mosselii]|uniref:DUF6708 domain-containing protein n=1 Tax=Pseudomonas mosselii TaxID=78327 RepID=UPI000A7FE780|nr:DUF6708 domain-containing protein [Pseudomonas mosselii]MBC3452701.1 hypothetical protein [Pseudomonas mosselii]MDH1104492.1 hypothetical protein [Pseudomonas mosselii]UVN42596.1 hypothetical protein NW905_15810 [Pseudomonas mosselii]
MYFFEWLSWLAAIDPKEEREAFEKQNKTIKKRDIYESEEEELIAAAKKSACDTPKSRGPIYVYNEHVLEMRSGMWEDKRGLISILSLAIILSAAFNLWIAVGGIEKLNHLIPNGKPYGEQLFMTIFFLAISLALSVPYLMYGLRFTRFEMFTSRHLLIRFNRTTQQVYLHRPTYCGGIVTLPWNGVSSSGADKKSAIASGVGLPLALTWSSAFTGTLRTELIWVGKSANNFAELQAEWEFIRRFMDDGPEGLPRPHITSHFPWPWQAFTPQFEGLTHYFRSSSRVIKCGLLLLSPAFLIIGTGHWLSLLLCWKPRWPKIIREAGLPGKPVPAVTTVDDYPPHIQERLRENAYLWAIRPGKRPERKPRVSKRRPKSQSQTPNIEKDAPHEVDSIDQP